MKNQKTRNRRQPVPHMTRMAERALDMERTPADPPRTSWVLAYMREFDVGMLTAARMIRYDPRRQ